MEIALSIPGFENIDKPNASAPTGLPQGVPTGGFLGTGQHIIWVGIELFLIGAILLSIFYIIRGGINMITSGGEKERFAKGRERVRYAIIGLLVIFASFFIINVVGKFFGVELLSFYNPTSKQQEQGPKSIDEQLMKICTDSWGRSYCTCLLNAKSNLTIDQQNQVSNAIIGANRIPQQIIDLAKPTCGDAK